METVDCWLSAPSISRDKVKGCIRGGSICFTEAEEPIVELDISPFCSDDEDDVPSVQRSFNAASCFCSSEFGTGLCLFRFGSGGFG